MSIDLNLSGSDYNNMVNYSSVENDLELKTTKISRGLWKGVHHTIDLSPQLITRSNATRSRLYPWKLF